MIKTVLIRNFKAIEKGRVKLTPLTAFIGYNGVGKSSLLEALETYKTIVINGLDAGISPFRDFEHIYYKGKKKSHFYKKNGIDFLYAPITFDFDTVINNYKAKFSSSIGQDVESKKNVYFLDESFDGQAKIDRDQKNTKERFFERRSPDSKTYHLEFYNSVSSGSYLPDTSMISNISSIRQYIESWQFLSMNTFLMGSPLPQKKTGGKISLEKDGRNIAEYILSIREESIEVFDGIIETIQYVLPYAKDIQPEITTEIEKMVYIRLTEQDFKVPGWLLSTGTLKLLALLSVFRNPNPAPLVVIEEIENGLDPRSINLIINEIRDFIKDKKSQVIITTHSPYLLDLLHLSQIVFVERKNGNVTFNRPYDFEELRNWSKEYSPGELYQKDLIQQIIR